RIDCNDLASECVRLWIQRNWLELAGNACCWSEHKFQCDVRTTIQWISKRQRIAGKQCVEFNPQDHTFRDRHNAGRAIGELPDFKSWQRSGKQQHDSIGNSDEYRRDYDHSIAGEREWQRIQHKRAERSFDSDCGTKL